MRDRLRTIVTTLLSVAFAASLAVTVGYSWYLRSPAYGDFCAAQLEAALGLPADIEAVAPRAWSTLECRGVDVWLPDRSVRVIRAERVLVRTLDASGAYELAVRGGRCELSSRTWLANNLRSLFESGVRPGFRDGGPNRVTFENVDLILERGPFALLLDEASGVVDFIDEQIGRGFVTCRSINGYALDRPIQLDVAFSAQETSIQVDRLELSQSTAIPLEALRMERFTGVPITCGTFEGNLTYTERDQLTSMIVRGLVRDVALPEVTSTLRPGGINGRVPEMSIERLQLVQGQPVRLEFSGLIQDVVIGDLLEVARLPRTSGSATLAIGALDVGTDGVEHLRASAVASDVDLQALTRGLGRGEMSGTLTAEIATLEVSQNVVTQLAGRVEVPRDPDQPHTIERTLVSSLAQELLGIGIPSFLPDAVSYQDFGLQFEVGPQEQLYLSGMHGPQEQHMLTLRVGGFDWPIEAPSRPIPLEPVLAPYRAQLRSILGADAPPDEVGVLE